jgi:hypothetical protein
LFYQKELRAGELMVTAIHPVVVERLVSLSWRLKYMGRREEVLEAAKLSVELHQRLATIHAAAFNADLAMALGNLSNPLSDLGCREEALEASWSPSTADGRPFSSLQR